MDIVDKVFEGLSLHDNADELRKATIKRREKELEKRKRFRWGLVGSGVLAIFALVFTIATIINLNTNDTTADSDIVVDFSDNSTNESADEKTKEIKNPEEDKSKEKAEETAKKAEETAKKAEEATKKSENSAANTAKKSQSDKTTKKKTNNSNTATTKTSAPEQSTSQTTPKTPTYRNVDNSETLFYSETAWLCYSGQTTDGCSNVVYPYLGKNSALTEEGAMRKAWATYTENGELSGDEETFEEWKNANTHTCIYHEKGFFKYWTCESFSGV